MTKKPSVALIGAGAMGGALFRGWIGAGSIDVKSSAIFDPGAPEEIVQLAQTDGVPVNPSDAGGFDVVVVAVKPQMAAKVLPSYADAVEGAVLLSVMAGTSVATLSTLMPNVKKFVRAMPNLPAAIGKGATGLYATDGVSDGERQNVEKLMDAVGLSVWVEHEKDIDLVTAVSGSGPAYFFLLAEALADAGAAVGLDPETAKRLAEATLAGAGALMAADGRSAGEIRKAVTSPGGTTAAALEILDGDEKAIRKLMKDAVAAAARRAGELAG